MSEHEKFESKMDELGLSDEQKDFMRTYNMERAESARTLLEAAVGDGVHFSEATDNGVFVNVEWLKMVLVTSAQGVLVGIEPDPTALLEVLSDTVEASYLFAGVDRDA